jgi:hypothetical protein
MMRYRENHVLVRKGGARGMHLSQCQRLNPSTLSADRGRFKP